MSLRRDGNTANTKGEMPLLIKNGAASGEDGEGGERGERDEGANAFDGAEGAGEEGADKVRCARVPYPELPLSCLPYVGGVTLPYVGWVTLPCAGWANGLPRGC